MYATSSSLERGQHPAATRRQGGIHTQLGHEGKHTSEKVLEVDENSIKRCVEIRKEAADKAVACSTSEQRGIIGDVLKDR
jgi:hypothetical protein